MSQPYRPDARPASGIRFALLGVWAVFTLSALAFVFNFGSNAPYADEWEFVPALVGQEPPGSWLWVQHNEHRLPLPRAIYLALFTLTHDFRTGMYLQVVTLSALALALMTYAARLRGRPEWPDAFFPVSLMHLGHWENFIMGYQICFVLYTLLTTGIVIVAMRATRETAFRSGMFAGGLLALLVLTGGSGLAVAPPVVVWLLYLAAIVWRTDGKGKALTLATIALLPLVYFVPYFTGYEAPPHHPPKSHNPVAVAIVAGEALAMGFGQGVSEVWPFVLILELALGVATALLLARQTTGDRTPALGLAAVAVGVALLTLAIGHGRAAIGLSMGLYSRYALLTWPLLGGAFLIWSKAGGKWVPVGLCLLAVLAFLPNMGTGMMTGNAIREHYQRLGVDTRAGMSAAELVEKHFPDSPNQFQAERAVRGIPLLKDAGIGVFAGK